MVGFWIVCYMLVSFDIAGQKCDHDSVQMKQAAWIRMLSHHEDNVRIDKLSTKNIELDAIQGKKKHAGS